MKEITVLLPAYNAEDYIKDCIDSVLSQTYHSFDFLIIDDGSSDKTVEIIEKYNDSRMKLIKNERNLGIVETLNKGLNLIKTPYIVRIDSDDIMSKNKLEKQINFIKRNNHIAVLGTQAIHFNNDSKFIGFSRMPLSTKKIRTYLLFANPIYHPSVLINNYIFKENNFKYNKLYQGSEDQDLWIRIIEKYDIVNIPNYLLKYRINMSGITQTLNKNRDIDKELSLLKSMYKKHNISILDSDISHIYKFVNQNVDVLDEISMEKVSSILLMVREQLDDEKFDLKYFDSLVSRYFKTLIIKQKVRYRKGKMIFNKYFQFDLKMTDKLIIFLRRVIND
ncbi:glycosyltransferase family 2 protein [Facklamia sp. P13064]|uniref:glycosyltransferase family 2 protein n=1 Tax=Facklamia sp. P13064 TaxID=3421953 RepID=UPI003D169978